MELGEGAGREGSVSGFGADLCGERKSAAVGFDYMKSTTPESTAGQLRFVSAESAARRN